MPVVRVTGLTELKRALQEISKGAPRELGKANKAAGEIVAVEARRLAPKGKHQGGGAITPISQSIGSTQSPTKVTVTAGGARTPHAAPTEWGGYIARRGFKGLSRRGKGEAHKRGRGGILTHVKKQPYLMPAIKAKIDEVVVVYGHMIDGLIEKFGR